MIEVWWHDAETGAQIESLGGKEAVEGAVVRVLPERRVLLQCLTGGISGATVFRTSPVMIGGGPNRHEVAGVLKIGKARELAPEVENYDTRVKNMLLNQTDYAMLDYPTDIFDIARRDGGAMVAINYRRVGRMTFGRYVADCLENAGVGAACDAVDRVLAILRPWQEMMYVETSKSLAGDGVYGFKEMTPFRLFTAECERLEGSNREHGPHWCTRIAAFWKDLQPQRMLETALHGDLHTENIMVEGDGQVTLIDFAACTDGHFLRDVCTLEAHLVMRALVPADEKALEPYLTNVAKLYERSYLADPFNAVTSTPVQAVIARLRRYAYASLMNGNAEYAGQYAFAVLRHAVRIAIRTGDTTDNQRRSALFVARLLSECLSVTDGCLQIVRPVLPPNGSQFGFLDGPEGRWFDEDGVSPAIAQACTADTWKDLAGEMMAARSIDLIGLVPVALLNEMLSRAGDASRQSRAMYLRYVTTVPAGRQHVGLAYAHPRWRGSLTGMRNLVRVLGGGTTAAPLQFDCSISMSNRASENCIMRLENQDGKARVLVITRLSEAAEGQPGNFALSQISDADRSWSNWFQQTRSAASPIILREVVCQPETLPKDSHVSAASDFRALRPTDLANYGDHHPGQGLMPIALTILRSEGAMGVRVLMKKRNWLTDNDTFDRYSFLSTRILTEDLTRTQNKTYTPRPNRADDREYLWEVLGRPKPWQLGQDVFLTAAHRDVYACTLLDLPQERFDLKGMHLISQGRPGAQTCFVVFVVNLEREEVERAQRNSGGMLDCVIQTLQLVSPEQLFDGSLPVNNFTLQRSEWLRGVLQ